jgi:transposase
VALVDGLGNLARFVLLPGQRHDTVGVPPLIKDINFGTLMGDKAFDVDWLRTERDERGAQAVIPPKANRKIAFKWDKAMYRWRHLIENYFAKLKEFRTIATRYDKNDRNFEANIYLAAAIIAAR